MSAIPSLREMLLYLRNNGARRSAAKFVARTRHLGPSLPAAGYELRFARPADLPLMDAFARRMAPEILRAWYGADYFFFLVLKDGRPVAYRCLSRQLHPGVAGFVRLRRHQLFMVDKFTVPALRRRGLSRRLAIAMTPALVARGYREVLGVHRLDNDDTVAAVRAKGLERLGIVARFRLPWRVWFAFDPAPR